jgi:excinuclease ABC subunit B
MYADNVTDSMRNALEETERRREKQIAYNTERGIDPQPLRERISDITAVLAREEADTAALLAGRSTSDGSRRRSPTPNLRKEGIGAGGANELEAIIADLNQQMLQAAGELKFELAARIRDELQDMKKELRQMATAGHI